MYILINTFCRVGRRDNSGWGEVDCIIDIVNHCLIVNRIASSRNLAYLEVIEPVAEQGTMEGPGHELRFLSFCS